jgi:G3E family GTPase
MTGDALPVSIITGYLGAGKTTFINQLLSNPNELAITILVNDFGSISIDDALIESQSADTITLANGCICCTLGGSLVTTLCSVLDAPRRPDWLIIEASGVAEPAKLYNIARAEPDLSLENVICLVDCATISDWLSDHDVGPVVARQVQQSDLLLLNKCDLVDEAKQSSVTALLQQQNSKARLFPTVDSKLPFEVARQPSCRSSENLAQAMLESMPGQSHEREFERWTLELTGVIKEKRFRKALRHLDPCVHRLKGLVRLEHCNEIAQVQYAGGRLKITPYQGSGSGLNEALVAIGPAGYDMATHLNQRFRNINGPDH